MNIKTIKELKALKNRYLFDLKENKCYFVTSVTSQKIILNKGRKILSSIFIEDKQNNFRFATEEEISEFKSLEEYKKIEEAKAFLKSKGFQTDNLWSLDDAKGKFNCTDEQAHDLLYKALTNDATMEQIWLAIDIEGEGMGLEPIEED